MNTKKLKTIHHFVIKGLKGGQVDFSAFAGKKILLVNVASQCGLTPQYLQLEELYSSFSEQFVVVGCPCNNFGGQEPGSNEEIHSFCTNTYGVSFPMTTKISTKGDNMHKLYQFVTQKAKNGLQDSEVSWNFQKYIFDEQGKLTHVFNPQVEPADEQVLDALGLNL